MKPVSIALILGATAISVVALVTVRPSHSHGETDTHRRVLLIEGLDRSGSYRQYLAGAVASAGQMASQLDPNDRLVCYALDTQPTELFDNPPPESAEELTGIVVDKLRHLPPAKGTYPAKFWADVSAKAQDTPIPCAIALFSDGDNDATAASETAIRSAAKSLACNKNVVFIAIFGVDPENRSRLNAAFACMGYDRFRLYGPQEANTDAITACLEQARNYSKEAR